MPKMSYGTHDAESLRGLQKTFAEWIRELKELEASLEDNDIESVVFTHQFPLDQVTESMPLFFRSGKRAIRAVLKNRKEAEQSKKTTRK